MDEEGSTTPEFSGSGETVLGSTNSMEIQRSSSGMRTSFRIRRQPSTYGELHDLVSKRKLGEGSDRGLVGLDNLGNTCFMNSALQCLVNCEPLTDYFLGFDWVSEINSDNFLGHKGLMAEAFGKLASEMWAAPKSCLVPRDFKRQAGESMPLFAGYDQQDVQEFLAFMLDAVHEDLNRVPDKERKYVEAKEAREGESEELVAREAWKGYLERNRSIIVDLFQGQLRSALQCGVCGKQSVTFDPFMYLSVPLPEEREDEGAMEDDPGIGEGEEAKKVSLDECIRLFCEVETLEGENAWYCPSCKKHQPATKKLDLWKMPPVLIVHLKRFAGMGKISTPVSFPLVGLDLSDVVRSPQKEAPDYDLFATANHHGTAIGGHYTARARNRVSGQWHEFNDQLVSSLEPPQVQEPSAYVLFYIKMSTVEVFESMGGDMWDLQRAHVAGPSSPSFRPAFDDGVAGDGRRYPVSPITGEGFGGDGDAARVAVAAGGGEAAKRSPVGGAERKAVVVRRQSVSKPHNWPHLPVDQQHAGAFKSTLSTVSSRSYSETSSGASPMGVGQGEGLKVKPSQLPRSNAVQGYGGMVDSSIGEDGLQSGGEVGREMGVRGTRKRPI